MMSSVKRTIVSGPHFAWLGHFRSFLSEGHNRVAMHKAKEILEHGEVHGQALTKKQRGLFGAIAGGARLRKKV